ncbi:DMT family transporter [Anianabacter salinae]|uniref:DMT family transporter n=1 Tax=Anianabacter salinae TaxID=2851023 RepID=UPI00225DEFF6|nr:DMT family transporter [Anianabacter salinae]MBV0912978.1 DMT family transporter [Anianabacter salinae]
MDRKDRIDAFGALSLVSFAMLLAFNQVVIKVVNDGLQPAFFAGLRSALGAICLYGWMRLRGIPLSAPKGTVVPGILAALFFSGEFLLLFLALDLTTVSRSAILFYSMPVWLTIGAHFLLPGDALTMRKMLGLAAAMAGVVVAIGIRPDSGEASLAGDIMALGAAVLWAGTALLVRGTRLSSVRPEMQLLWQLVLSAPVLLVAALFFGPLIRDLAPIHLWGLAFQSAVIVSAGFLFWFWLLTIYPASGVASFSFLSPVLAVLLGWLLLNETITPAILVALALVAVGIVLINRPARRPRQDAAPAQS